jgi:hypothetical protein
MTYIDAAAMPVAIVGDGSAHRHAHAEGDQWRIRIRIRRRRRNAKDWKKRRRRIDHHRIVLRDVNDIRLRGQDLDNRIGDTDCLLVNGVLEDLVGGGDDLLLGGFERPGLAGLAAQDLNGVHDCLLISHESLA